MDQCPHAHYTRLKGDKQGCADQSVVLALPGGLPQDDYFRMGGRVVPADRAVASCGEQSILVDKHCADRDLGPRSGFFGTQQGLSHPEIIVLVPILSLGNMGSQISVSLGFFRLLVKESSFCLLFLFFGHISKKGCYVFEIYFTVS